MMKAKQKKNKNFNKNQKSFYFEDYLETNQNKKQTKNTSISQDRIYILFFFFFCLVVIFSIKITIVSVKKLEILKYSNKSSQFNVLRRDIVDRNSVLLSRNVKSFHAAVNPILVKNKENFLLKLRLNFPNLPIKKVRDDLEKGTFFYLKRGLNQNDK